jgi:hypothetical protein
MDDTLKIIKGKTFERVVRWEKPPLVYKAITAITRAGGAVITSASHGVPNGWRVAVVSAGGMRQINAANWPLADDDFHVATVLTANTLELNDVNSTDYRAYTSGGYLVYYTPASLSGIQARFQIRADEDSTAALVTADETDGITVDDSNKTMTLRLEATDTDDYTFEEGVCEFEVQETDGTVTQMFRRAVVVEDEIVRP